MVITSSATFKARFLPTCFTAYLRLTAVHHLQIVYVTSHQRNFLLLPSSTVQFDTFHISLLTFLFSHISHFITFHLIRTTNLTSHNTFHTKTLPDCHIPQLFDTRHYQLQHFKPSHTTTSHLLISQLQQNPTPLIPQH